LLIDPTHAFEGADIEGVLGAQITGMSRIDFTADLVILAFLFQGGNLRFRENQPLLGDFDL